MKLINATGTNDAMVGPEMDQWVTIQERTFKNWINDKLRSCDIRVDCLQTDFCDGTALCALVEILRGRPLGRNTRVGRVSLLEATANVSLALEALVADGVKLVNIGAEDVCTGNLKLILGLIWTIIHQYQIGRDQRLPPKRLMLSWINAVLHPHKKIQNFTYDWSDGLALQGIIEYCSPGTFPDWFNGAAKDKLANCESAMRTAKTLWDIPLIINPHSLAESSLDEQSTMTYLSYFMTKLGPGYNATLSWVQQIIPQAGINNFNVDWNDGYAISALVYTLGGFIPNWPNIDRTDRLINIQTAMDESKQSFDINHVITSLDMMSADVGHIGVMAYVTWHRAKVGKAARKKSLERTEVSNSVEQHKAESPEVPLYFPPEISGFSVPEDPPIDIDMHISDVSADNWNASNVDLQSMEDSGITEISMSLNEDRLVSLREEFLLEEKFSRAENTAPAENPKVEEGGTFLAPELLEPYIAVVSRMALSSVKDIRIETVPDAQSCIEMIQVSPSGEQSHIPRCESSEGCLIFRFAPYVAGDWKVCITRDGERLTYTERTVRVFDTSKAKIILPATNLWCHELASLTVDTSACSNEGEGLIITVLRQGSIVPHRESLDPSGKLLHIEFSPETPGLYDVSVTSDGIHLPGSPLQIHIFDAPVLTTSALVSASALRARSSSAVLDLTNDSESDLSFKRNSNIEAISDERKEGSLVNLRGPGLRFAFLNRLTQFTIELSQSGGELECTVKNLDGEVIPHTNCIDSPGQHTITYTPVQEGTHLIELRSDSETIQGSPFLVNVRQARVYISGMEDVMYVGKKSTFFVDASEMDKGRLQMNSSVPILQVTKQQRNVYCITLLPNIKGSHDIILKHNGEVINGSPYMFEVLSKKELKKLKNKSKNKNKRK